jgi:alkylation response protein AidB-like acyl-CoA dehydrogenase
MMKENDRATEGLFPSGNEPPSNYQRPSQYDRIVCDKDVAADGCNEVCRKAFNIFGSYGLLNEFPAQRFLRDSYFPLIGGGTSDIMRVIVARQLSF